MARSLSYNSPEIVRSIVKLPLKEGGAWFMVMTGLARFVNDYRGQNLQISHLGKTAEKAQHRDLQSTGFGTVCFGKLPEICHHQLPACALSGVHTSPNCVLKCGPSYGRGTHCLKLEKTRQVARGQELLLSYGEEFPLASLPPPDLPPRATRRPRAKKAKKDEKEEKDENAEKGDEEDKPSDPLDGEPG